MSLLQVIVSLCTGTLLGIVYGFSFLIMGKKTQSFSGAQLFLVSTVLTLVRLGSLGALLIFSLQVPMINSMLLVISLLITFWIILAK